MNILLLVVSLVTICIGTNAAMKIGARIQKLADKKYLSSESNDDETSQEQNHGTVIRFDPDKENFPVKGTPVEYYYHESDKLAYGRIIEMTINYYHKRRTEEGFCKILYALRDQNHQMALIHDELVYIVDALELSDVRFLKGRMQEIFDVYVHNCEDSVNYIRHYYSTVDTARKDSKHMTLSDIVKDNDKLIKSLEECIKAIREYCAKIKNDETPAHLTDFTATEDINDFTERLRGITAMAEEKNKVEPVPTIKIPRRRGVTMLGMTDAEINPKSNEDVGLQDLYTSHTQTTLPSGDGF